MNIQIISYSTQNIKCEGYNIDCSTLNAPKAFDAYDVNIINLQSKGIWENNKDSKAGINQINDFESLGKLISTRKKSQVIVLLPQNYDFYYDYYSPSKKYYKALPLKDMLDILKSHILSKLFVGNWISHFDFIFGITQTLCNSSLFTADFSFETTSSDVLTKSKTSANKTTIKLKNNIILSTLHFDRFDIKLKDFLMCIGVDSTKEEIPEWLKTVELFDDKKQTETVELAAKEIEALKLKIDEANKKLEENLVYKRALVDNGQALVNIVFDMLEKMLGYDLSDFEDENKEDFLIKLNDVTFIGEIKGITSNIKSENVSQVDVHYQSYLDKLREDHVTEEVKPILIINSFRTKPITEREAVHHIQIDLAIRNGSLIITTYELLKLFEAYLNNQTTSSKIIEVFKTKTGLFSVNDCLVDNEDNSQNMI
ncbi:MAG: hypothetical protein IJD78_06210 [Clostridia bacterium]|nr:hypothetical protein [Clostridia bacterium]